VLAFVFCGGQPSALLVGGGDGEQIKRQVSYRPINFGLPRVSEAERIISIKGLMISYFPHP
ncbi:MAG: hypothetical protein WCK17_17375, partial [Verrucomicrobiota bacterium]